MRRIGVDVGGTNTDAVLVDNEKVLGAVKTPTTEDVTTGVKNALSELIEVCGDKARHAASVTVGTTHFLNAVIERKRLNRTAALRICLPASASLPPFVDWPQDISELADGGVYMVEGGSEYDGRPIREFDEMAIYDIAKGLRETGITSIGICSVFSPLIAEDEIRAAEIIAAECPEIRITCSHNLGRIGLLERENATLLNAALQDLAAKTTTAFKQALVEVGITAPLYISLNDGTVTSVDRACQYPVYCFASGATNSMRGAAFLSGIDNAIVCDVGGTTSDVGCLVNGFPREANNTVYIGGIRTLFRMPDILSIGIGGGTRVSTDPLSVGPESVGFRLTEQAHVFGGSELTLTDIAVASGLMDVGDGSLVSDLPKSLLKNTLGVIREKLERVVDQIKVEAGQLPLIVVGGGAPLIPKELAGVSDVLHVENYAVANAVGAAIAQISGEADQVFHGLSRDDALAQARKVAETRAVDAGANETSLKIVEMEDIPIAYLPGHAIRARVRVVGELL